MDEVFLLNELTMGPFVSPKYLQEENEGAALAINFLVFWHSNPPVTCF